MTDSIETTAKNQKSAVTIMKDISISAIADTLDRFRLMDDPYEWHDNEGVESTKDIAEHLFDNEYRNAVIRELEERLMFYSSNPDLNGTDKTGKTMTEQCRFILDGLSTVFGEKA